MKSQIEKLLRAALDTVLSGSGVAKTATITLEPTKDPKHGDLATNLALTLA
jgi:arginyl-tRNA synthetase